MGRFANRAKDLLFMPGTATLWRRRLVGKVMALVYHRVDDPARYDFLERGGTPVIRPEALATELIWLRDIGARFMTFTDIRRGEFPDDNEFGVVVTFDDGFRDNYTTGLEVLDSIGIKGVFFQCSAMIDGRELIPEHALYWFAAQSEVASVLVELARIAGWPSAKEATAARMTEHLGRWIREAPADSLKAIIAAVCERFPTQEQAATLYPAAADIRRAVEQGHEIGSHGHEHLHRATLDADGFESELSTSSSRIEAVTGVRPAAFSYPFSAYLPGDREICGRYFEQALTVNGQLIQRDSDPLAMGRFTWPGPARNGLRLRRWLLTGKVTNGTCLTVRNIF